MARPLRIEFAGALYHVTARGNARADIYLDTADRRQFMQLLRNTLDRYDWSCHAYCLMDNHYHLLLETNTASLSKGMKFLNGTYTQYFNRRHQRVGHVFQGRFKAILVQKDSHLLELTRYIVLNPVRAQMVHNPEDWPWSSYRAMLGHTDNDACLSRAWVLASFAATESLAQQRYRDFVNAGRGQASPWQQLKNQIFLGDENFVNAMQDKLRPGQSLRDIPKRQKQAAIRPLSFFAEQYPSRDAGMAQAYRSGHYTLTQVGEHFGVSYATVSRAVKREEARDSVKCKA